MFSEQPGSVFGKVKRAARAGRFLLTRTTSKVRQRTKLRELRTEIMKRRHLSIRKQGLFILLVQSPNKMQSCYSALAVR